MSRSPLSPAVQAGTVVPQGSTSGALPPDVAEHILRLLCNGAMLENSLHVTCYVIDTDGSARDLRLMHPDPFCNKFCLCTRGLETASNICGEWHQAVAAACHDAGPAISPQVLECPFGLSVMVTPVEHQGQVRMVLFAGNWRESGAEGLIYHRLKQAAIPGEELDSLVPLVHEVEALMSEKLEARRARLEEFVQNLSQTIGLMYAQYLTGREHVLSRSIHETLASLPTGNLHEACRATDKLLGQICGQLDIKLALFFANTGSRDRLDVRSWAGVTEKMSKGLYLEGKPRELLEQVARWPAMGPEEQKRWLNSRLAKQRGQSVPSRLSQLEELLPIELGYTFCGILAIGPRKRPASPQEHVMSYEDHHQLALVAHRHLKNGLRDMVERQEVAEVLLRTSHILRGPLMGIQGEIEALKQQLVGDEPEKPAFREICENIQNQVDNIAAQAELMEEATKTSLGGRVRPFFQRAPLAAVINKVLQGMTAKAKERSITFGGLDAIRTLPEVEFDWNQMRVVFANLLHNACKYAHYRTSVNFRAGQTVLSGRRAVRVVISDLGTGISPAEIKDHIFKPGFRGSVRDAIRDIEGTGMGLAVCKEIVEETHHGRIYAESVEQWGERKSYQHCKVEFYVELPVTQPKSPGG